MIVLDYGLVSLRYVETADRRLLFAGERVVAIQLHDQDAEVDTDYQDLSDFFMAVTDGPCFDLIPSGKRPIFTVHCAVLFHPDHDHQLTDNVSDAPFYLITASFDDGVKSFAIDNDMAVYNVHMGIDGRLMVDAWGIPLITNLQYLRSTIRTALKDEMGEDWQFFR
ncbi:MAG: hypothetical protein DRQ48_03865 [Gammaproteobacteria bacterium]|nr:MAG: hypothetical protein DRQ48_03865 [Gammaproteobacteria bacterium]